ncbi:isochorismatase family protein [Afifella pfennigii]|uniref:isochorismatase family protein n=1 Tax=Afifella pfennigii TaxID=209897 RepID=UPI00146FA9D5|nr:isochorismatase family protein [Afifella pfennigii]
MAVDLQGENAAGGVWQVEGYEAILANAAKTLNAARAAGIPVIYSRHALDPQGHTPASWRTRFTGRCCGTPSPPRSW